MAENEGRTLLSRRRILAAGVAVAGAIPLLTRGRAVAAPESNTAGLRLTAGTRTLDVNGKPARVFGLTGPNGNPGITLSPGERFHVDLVNQAGTSTLVHWHGQLPPWKQDSFRWPQTLSIPAGDTRGCSGHPAFPTPSVFLGRMDLARLGRIAPQDRGLTPEMALAF